jgi:hypothetical protein
MKLTHNEPHSQLSLSSTGNWQQVIAIWERERERERESVMRDDLLTFFCFEQRIENGSSLPTSNFQLVQAFITTCINNLQT